MPRTASLQSRSVRRLHGALPAGWVPLSHSERAASAQPCRIAAMTFWQEAGWS
jgi:hypothetical protein